MPLVTPGSNSNNKKRHKNAKRVKPDGGPELGPLRARYHRVDVHGVPVPDRAPTGEGEDDHLPNMSHVDMFSLGSAFAVTDIGAPVEGGELTLELRRTAGIRSHLVNSDPTHRPIPWAMPYAFGLGWDTNLSTRVIVSGTAGDPLETAEVYDDVGNVYQYAGDGIYFTPDIYHSFANAAIHTPLVRVGSNLLELREPFGTRVVFEQRASKGTLDKNDAPYTETYYRPTQVIDRNGNTLVFEYSPGGPSARDEDLLVRAVFEKAHPERRIEYSYTDFGDDLTVGDYGWRLTQSKDSLGRVFQYSYAPEHFGNRSAHYVLRSVARPAVVDDTAVSKAPVSPLVQFHYYVNDLRTYDHAETYKYVAPASITDARGNTTSLGYSVEPFPIAVVLLPNGPHPIFEDRPRVQSMATIDGTAVFRTIERNERRVHTTVTDTAGHLVSYDYRCSPQPSDNDWGCYIWIQYLQRTTNLATGEPSALFEWNRDPNGNLARVTDMSGNVIQYRYTSGDPSDPYDHPLNPVKPHDTSTNPNHYEAMNRPAERTIDPLGLTLVTSYRYETSFNKEVLRTDAEGATIRSVMDGSGNRIEIDEELGKRTRLVYAPDGFLSESLDPDGRVVTMARTFNPLDLSRYYTVTKTVVGYPATPLNIVTTATTDILGNTVSLVDGNGNTTTQEFDALNRLTAVVRPPVEDIANPGGPPVSSRSEQHYDLNGNVVREVDANGNAIVHTFDLMNRETVKRVRMTDPAQDDDQEDLISRTAYTPVGQIRQITDANGKVREYEYDELLRPTVVHYPIVPGPGGPVRYEDRRQYGPNSGAGAFAYWAGWQPTRQVNKRGFATDYVYDAAYRLLRIVKRLDNGATMLPSDSARPAEPTVEKTYNKVDLVVVQISRNESLWGTREDEALYTYYDALHRQTVSVTGMDDLGPPLPLATVVNDASAFARRRNDLVVSRRYDLAGNVTASTDPEGQKTEYEFDGASRVVLTLRPTVIVNDPQGYNPNGAMRPLSTVSYDGNGNGVLTEDANHTKTANTFDGQNRLVRSIADVDGNGVFSPSFNGPDIVTESHYDLGGRLVRAIDSRGGATDVTFDRANRNVRTERPQVPDAARQNRLTRPTTVSVYDKNSNVLALTDPMGVQTASEYDGLNRPIKVIVAANTSDRAATETTYDGNNNPVSITFFNGRRRQQTRYTYDAFDRKVTETQPDVGDGHTRVTETAYDRSDNAVRVRDPKGQVIERAYDRAGRPKLVIRLLANGTIEETQSFSYNRVGKPVLVSDLNGTSRYEYDALYRVTSETRDTRGLNPYTVESAFDARGNQTLKMYPDSGRQTVQKYDRMNRLVTVVDGLRQTQIEYDSSGNRISQRAANGVITQTAYDGLNRPSAIVAKKGKQIVFQSLMGYDLAGNRIRVSEGTGGAIRAKRYSYDRQYRLVEEAWRGHSAKYAYDAAGNRLSDVRRTGTNTSSVTCRYDDLNRLVASRAGRATTSYEYDLNGNLVSRGAGTGARSLYTWDTLNRLVAVAAGPAGTPVFRASYDYRWRRLSVETQSQKAFRYDQGNCIQEVQGAKVVRELVRGGGLRGGIGGILYADRPGPRANSETYIYNQVGHTMALTNVRGLLKTSYEYDAFGGLLRQVGKSVNDYLANTKQLDAVTGLYNHGMRYYDPLIGRYISRDPAGYRAGPNPYAYVSNNPINRVDPAGLGFWDDLCDALTSPEAGIVAGVVAAVAVAVVAVVAAPVVLPVLAAASEALIGAEATATVASAVTYVASSTVAQAGAVGLGTLAVADAGEKIATGQVTTFEQGFAAGFEGGSGLVAAGAGVLGLAGGAGEAAGAGAVAREGTELSEEAVLSPEVPADASARGSWIYDQEIANARAAGGGDWVTADCEGATYMDEGSLVNQGVEGTVSRWGYPADHCFLTDPETGAVIDPTAGQFVERLGGEDAIRAMQDGDSLLDSMRSGYFTPDQHQQLQQALIDARSAAGD
jgi:RHS repeat-associated protein